MIQIYHNPRCGKSRNCLALVTEKEAEVAIIKYLETPPTRAELEILIEKLGLEPIQLVRRKEKIWIFWFIKHYFSRDLVYKKRSPPFFFFQTFAD